MVKTLTTVDDSKVGLLTMRDKAFKLAGRLNSNPEIVPEEVRSELVKAVASSEYLTKVSSKKTKKKANKNITTGIGVKNGIWFGYDLLNDKFWTFKLTGNQYQSITQKDQELVLHSVVIGRYSFQDFRGDQEFLDLVERPKGKFYLVPKDDKAEKEISDYIIKRFSKRLLESTRDVLSDKFSKKELDLDYFKFPVYIVTDDADKIFNFYKHHKDSLLIPETTLLKDKFKDLKDFFDKKLKENIFSEAKKYSSTKNSNRNKLFQKQNKTWVASHLSLDTRFLPDELISDLLQIKGFSDDEDENVFWFGSDDRSDDVSTTLRCSKRTRDNILELVKAEISTVIFLTKNEQQKTEFFKKKKENVLKLLNYLLSFEQRYIIDIDFRDILHQFTSPEDKEFVSELIRLSFVDSDKHLRYPLLGKKGCFTLTKGSVLSDIKFIEKVMNSGTDVTLLEYDFEIANVGNYFIDGDFNVDFDWWNAPIPYLESPILSENRQFSEIKQFSKTGYKFVLNILAQKVQDGTLNASKLSAVTVGGKDILISEYFTDYKGSPVFIDGKSPDNSRYISIDYNLK